MSDVAPVSRSQRLLLLFGAVLAFSAGAHALVWLAAGMPSLVGPVTWRKPIVFGLSLAVLAWSLAWVVRHLPDSAGLRRQTRWLVGLLSVELLLIDMQQWRGVGSHFNIATPFDGAVFQAMGAIILAAAGILAWWTWRLFVAPRPDAPRAHLAAARAAMVLLAAGNVIGIFLAVWGTSALEATGRVPATFGPAGNVRLTHAIALHAMQVLPMVAVALTAVPGATLRLAAIRRAAVGYTFVLLWAVWQAAAGRAPEDVTMPSVVLLIGGVGLLVWTALTALAARIVPATTRPVQGGSR